MPALPSEAMPTPAAAPLLPRPDPSAAGLYRPPDLLRDLRLLDALELTGTTEQAGRWLAVSQPTVSRRCRRLAEDFGIHLEPRPTKRCQLPSTLSLRQLRLSARWHRFEAGVLAMGSDPLHQGLLGDLDGLLPVPHRFRAGESWLELVRQGVIDAALVSSLELERPEVGRDPAERSRWLEPPEPDRLHLGHWPLRLAVCGSDGDGDGNSQARLLVPPAPLAPGLRNLLGGQGVMVTCPAAEVHDLAAWRRRMARQGLAVPAPAALLDQETGPFAGLSPLPHPANLREHLWLLLPSEWRSVPALRHTVNGLRRLAVAAGALPEAEAPADQPGSSPSPDS